MTAEAQSGRIATDVIAALDHQRSLLFDCEADLEGARKAVHRDAQAVTASNIGHGRRTHIVICDVPAQWLSRDKHQRLANLESELGIKGERAQMARRLHQSYLLNVAVAGLVNCRLHQPPSRRAPLRRGINRERSDRGDRGASECVEEDAAEDALAALGHEAKGVPILD